MRKKARAVAFGLLIILLSLSACNSSAQTDNSSKGSNQTQPTTKIETHNNNSRASAANISPTPPTKSENEFAILPAELASKGKLTAENGKSCQNSSEFFEREFDRKARVRTYRVEFASGENSVIIEDYAANREIVGANGKQLRPYIDENLVNEYIVSAKAGQTMTLQVSPAQRKEVREDARLDVGGLYLEIATLEDCKNVETLPLAWKTDAEVRGKFRIKLPKTGDYSILVASQDEESGYRLKVIIQ